MGPDSAEIDLGSEHAGAEPVDGTRRPRLTILLGAGVVLVLLLGIGAVVGWRLLSSGAKPTDNLPASVAAYAGVDFAPAPDQAARLVELAGKLPHSGATTDGHSFDPAGLIGTAIGDHPGLDVRRDITSWLGVRFGVGAWMDRQKRPYVLIAAASRNDGAARSGLRRLHDGYPDVSLGYLVSNGLVLIAVGERDAQAAVEAARTEAATHPLTNAPAFLEATRWLDGPQVVTAWMDNARYRDFTKAYLPKDSGPVTGDDLLGPATGQVVLGVRATGDGLTARFRSSGTDAAGTAVPDALSRLGDLPGNSAVAAVARIPTHLAGPTGSPLDPASMAFGLFFEGMLTFGNPAETPPGHRQLSAAEQQELDALLSKDPTTLTPAEHKRIQALLGMDPTVAGPPVNTPRRVLTEAEQQEVAALMAKDPSQLTAADRARLTQLLGFDRTATGGPGPGLTRDPTEPLAGASISLSISDLTGTPAVKAVVEATSADRARQLASSFGDRLTITANGNVVTATSPGYTGSGGRLADQRLFQKAMADSPANVSTAVFVDLRRTVPAAQRDKLGGLLAVSLVVGEDHGAAVGVIRLLA
jgi:hypothetical protein